MSALAVVLPGETLDSEVIVQAVGPVILSQYHSAWHGYRNDPKNFVPPSALADGWEEYLSIVAARRVPPEKEHIDIHEGHGTVIREDERPLLTPEFIAAAAIVGEPDEVSERLRRIEASGLSEFVLRLGYSNARETISRFSRYVRNRL